MSSLFNLDIQFNTEGWGPVAGVEISQFIGVPYAHFDKKDKIGRAADFVSLASKDQRQQRRRHDDMASGFAYRHDAVEDSTFRLVDTTSNARKNKRPTARTGAQRTNRAMTGRGGRGDTRGGPGQGNMGRGGKGKNTYVNRRRNDRKIDRSPSVVVGADWELVEEFELNALLKLAANIPEVEDLLWAGVADKYNDLYDKVSPKNTKTIRRCDDKVFHNVSSSDDPVLQGLAAEEKGNVFVTDSVLAHIMAATRSVYSWDIVVEKVGDLIFFGKRNDSNLDLLTVNETALDTQYLAEELEEYNQPEKLAEEATMINQNFSQQVLAGQENTRKTYEANPFADNDEGVPASVAYRYRVFHMGDLNIVSRCEVHGWSKREGEEIFVNAYALNEWDSRLAGGPNWRYKIDQQRGSVLATEVKNNACKVAKWTAQAMLAGVQEMKLGYVTRTSPTNPAEHILLAVQPFKPKDFAQQINLNLNNAWGIVKMLCSMLLAKEDGKYVMLKDPNKPVIRIFSVPADTFVAEEDEDEEEGDDEEDADEDEEDM